mmetsp:Transcript_29222/g.41133  ORF Transcript_29222/g.41133 Transcript_29222/m.41133 type:complete len:295 (-) Transcript_29222:64-948(-)
MSSPRLRVGVVPEHFSLPWYKGQENGTFKKHNVEIQLEVYPRGTGSMCRALRNNELDVAVALTEGIISDIANCGSEYAIIATYIDSPLRWAINVHPDSNIQSEEDLKGKTFGISRFGSGSHLMSFILGKNHSWNMQEDIQFKVKGGIDDLLEGIRDNTTDAFMWETFTVKPYLDAGQLRKISEVVTPWPCFVIAARRDVVSENKDYIKRFLQAIQEACIDFKNNPQSLEFISEKCNLSLEDAQKWFESVSFSKNGAVSCETLTNTVNILVNTHVLSEAVKPEVIYDADVANVVA